MFIWNVENMVLMNQKGKILDLGNNISREEKIEFIDKMQEGKLSYLLDLLKKFNDERTNFKYDNRGDIKTSSLKPWLKKNDTLSLVDDWYHYGAFSLLGINYNIQSRSNNMDDDNYCGFVDNMFHKQLEECEKLERQYFFAHDEFSILKLKIEDKCEQYDTSFGINLNFSSNGDVYIYDEGCVNSREVTLEELKELSDKYDKLDEFVKKLALEITLKY